MQSYSYAIEHGQFESWYQPKVPLIGYHPPEAEVLARWVQADNHVLSAAQFIADVESSGDLLRMTQVLFEQGLLMINRCRYNGVKLKLNFNLDAKHLDNPYLLDWFCRRVTAFGIPAYAVGFELKAAKLPALWHVAQEHLSLLRHYGFRLSLDNYDHRYKSLIDLPEPVFGEVKLDISLVEQLKAGITSEIKYSIAQAQAAGLVVVAEGVEVSEQFDRLGTLGVDCAQGYYISQPLDHKLMLQRIRREFRMLH